MAARCLVLAALVLTGCLAAPQLAAAQSPGERKMIAMVVYPDFTALDLVGPHQVFSGLEGYDVKLVWKNTDLVRSDSGLTLKPDLTFQDCPQQVSILFVPGGTRGTVQAMQDPDVLAFVKSRGEKAEYVTSVCTGSLVLGAAGLLRGYKATTHWGATEVLQELGAEVVQQRMVMDRNRLTGGGVTAGIDFGLTLAAKLKGEKVAQRIQLVMEYAPAPPFKSGSPAEAGPEFTAQTRTRFAPFVQAATAAAKKAKAAW
jgi:cyclohexyl-isocyanide hydratase